VSYIMYLIPALAATVPTGPALSPTADNRLEVVREWESQPKTVSDSTFVSVQAFRSAIHFLKEGIDKPARERVGVRCVRKRGRWGRKYLKQWSSKGGVMPVHAIYY